RCCAVASSIVDDEHLEIAHRLPENRANRVSEKRLRVVRGRDDADGGAHHGPRPAAKRKPTSSRAASADYCGVSLTMNTSCRNVFSAESRPSVFSQLEGKRTNRPFGETFAIGSDPKNGSHPAPAPP